MARAKRKASTKPIPIPIPIPLPVPTTPGPAIQTGAEVGGGSTHIDRYHVPYTVGHVSFPRRFRAAPVVVASVQPGAANIDHLVVNIESVSPTGFDFIVSRSGTTAPWTAGFAVHWHAVGELGKGIVKAKSRR